MLVYSVLESFHFRGLISIHLHSMLGHSNFYFSEQSYALAAEQRIQLDLNYPLDFAFHEVQFRLNHRTDFGFVN